MKIINLEVITKTRKVTNIGAGLVNASYNVCRRTEEDSTITIHIREQFVTTGTRIKVWTWEETVYCCSCCILWLRGVQRHTRWRRLRIKNPWGDKNDAEGGLFSTQKVSIHAESNAMRNSVHVIVRRYNCYNGASTRCD